MSTLLGRMFAGVFALALAAGPTVCGSNGSSTATCGGSCAPTEVCRSLCLDAGDGITAAGCVTPRDGGYVARDGGPFVACPE